MKIKLEVPYAEVSKIEGAPRFLINKRIVVGYNVMSNETFENT
jgi:hypothetical protein